MKTDYISCEGCGAVFDIEALKEIESKKSEQQQSQESYNGTWQYKDFYDFEQIICPICKTKTQRG